MRRGRLVALVASLGVGVFAVSCKDPTEVEIVVHTNVPYHAGLVTAFTVGAAATEDAPATTETRDAWGSEGFVGSLVVVPGGAKDGRLSVKVVMGVDREARECMGSDTHGCIVSRRTLRYVPHERLVLPIELYATCAGVTCNADSTCDASGACVTAEIDPQTCGSEHGCDVPGGTPPAGPAPDASIDGAGPNSIAEASFEGARGLGGPLCPIKGGPACASTEVCCAHGAGKYECSPACPVTDSAIFSCTSARRCGKDFCCLGKVKAICDPQDVCAGAGGRIVCEDAIDCPPGFTCNDGDAAYPGMSFCGSTN